MNLLQSAGSAEYGLLPLLKYMVPQSGRS